MNLADFDHIMRVPLEFLRQNPSLAEFVVFLLGFGESIAFVSLFIPSTVLFLGIGTMQSAAGGSFWSLALAGAAGAFVGDILSYLLGRHYKHRVATMWPFSRNPELLPRSRAMIERWGGLSVVIGKFLGMLRPFIPVVAGMMDMPWLRFLVASAVSSIIWSAAFLAPGFGVTAIWR